MESHPLFVYGTLRANQAAGHLLAGLVERRAPARAYGRRVGLDAPFPAVDFEDPAEPVDGELVWLLRDRYEEALAMLDRYEDAPQLFRRRLISVVCESDELVAVAYEWAGTSDRG